MATLETFEFETINKDLHSIFSIELGELVDAGFDPFGDDDWTNIDWYDDETRERWQSKFLRHFEFFEIGIMPPLKWRRMLTSRMLDIMPKYKPVYKALAEGVDIRAVQDEYLKQRDVYSDFPATQISPSNQDYASTANDTEWEKVTDGSWFDFVRNIRGYDDVDAAIFREIGDMFACLGTVSAAW